MKTLIFPDVHNKWKRVEKVIAEEGADLIIFTGDYFDDYGDTPKDARETALWLKDSVHKPDRIHLVGNHDQQYMFNTNIYMRCSGWSAFKDIAINEVMDKAAWEKLRWYYIHEGILFTHAGLTDIYMKLRGDRSLETFLKSEGVKATKEAFGRNSGHWFFVPGQARGGIAEKGGLTWCDFNDEFVATEGIMQIFGHTPHKEPIIKKWAAALDTRLNYYGVLRAGKLEVKKIEV